MADQAAVRDGNGVRINSAMAEGVVGNLAEFGNDVAELAELQAKLALIDMKEATGQAAVPAVLMAGGLALALGAVPVILMGLARLLAAALNVREGWMLLLVGGLVAIGAGLLAALMLPRIIKSFASLSRTREELTRNVAWLRTVLVHSGRSRTRR